MLNINVEKTIFITLFISSVLLTCFLTTQIKREELPINLGISPEELIESEFEQVKEENLNYEYIIKGDVLFVCVETISGDRTVDIAFKNKNPGYMFDLPGGHIGPIAHFKTKHFSLPNDIIRNTIYKWGSTYTILLQESFKNNDIDFYIDGIKMESLTVGDKKLTAWFSVVPDLSDNFEIYAIYKGETIHILNNDELKDMWGVK